MSRAERLRELLIGEWRFLPELHLLCGEGGERHLEPKQAAVLLALAEAPGLVVTKEQLFARVWADLWVTDEVLTQAIYQLRRALGDAARAPRYIQTIPRRGYRLVAEVRPLAPPLAAAAATGAATLAREAGASSVGGSRSLASARRWGRVAAVAGVAALLGPLGAVRGGGDGGSRASALVRQAHGALAGDSGGGDLAAVRALEEAVRLNPDSAVAWEALAAARWSLVARGALPRDAGLPLVEEAARRALAGDARRSAAWTTIGRVHAARWEWGEADRALRRAIALAPGSAAAHAAWAEHLLLTGRRVEARAAIGAALARDRESPRVLLAAGFVYTMLREVAAAAEAYQRVLAIAPGHPEAAQQLAKLRRGEGPPVAAITVAQVERLLAKQPLRPALVAAMFAEAGEEERALAWLRRAREEKDPALLLVRLDERWGRVHGDARYRAILDEVGL